MDTLVPRSRNPEICSNRQDLWLVNNACVNTEKVMVIEIIRMIMILRKMITVAIMITNGDDNDNDDNDNEDDDNGYNNDNNKK